MSLSEPDAAFLADRNLTFLFARRPDGSPAGWPMTYSLTEGMLLVSVRGPGQAAAALRDDPRVYVIVEQSPSYYEIAYVGIEGSAERIQDTAGRLTFDLTPRAVTSASFAKLAEPAD